MQSAFISDIVKHISQHRPDEELDLAHVRREVMSLISAAFDDDGEEFVCDVDGLGCGRELLLKPTGQSHRRPFVDTYDKKQHAGNRMVCFFFVLFVWCCFLVSYYVSVTPRNFNISYTSCVCYW